MTIFQSVLLGVVQGITEFLPVSSSGHLVVTERLLGIHFEPSDLQGLNVMLHAGTLIALLIMYFSIWKSILLSPLTKNRQHRKLFVALIIATIPAGVVGVLFEDQFATMFMSSTAIAVSFFLNALILIFAESYATTTKRTSWNPLTWFRGTRKKDLTLLSAFFIGVAQVAALPAAISRSGITISAGQLTGLSRKEALDFSFLMLTPVVAGATLLTLVKVWHGQIQLPHLPVTIMGVVTSCIFSVLAIMFLRQFVSRHSLAWFAPYLIGLSFFIYLEPFFTGRFFL